MEQRTIKGSHAIQVREWVDKRLGTGTFRELTRSGGDRWGIIVAGGWYEVDIVNQVLVEASRRTKVPTEEIATEIARLNALNDLATIYRLFLRVAQPQRVLNFTPKLWRTYVSFADATAIRNEPGDYLGQCDGLTEELVAWACGCWRGFIPTTIELAGGKNARGTIVKRWRAPNGSHSIQLEVKYQ